MAKIFQLREVEARKRALIAESEVYRQTLTLEIQNVRLYGVRLRRKFSIIRLGNPLFALAASIIGSRFLGSGSRRPGRGKWSRVFAASLMGWRLIRRFGPLVQGVLAGKIFRTRARPGTNPEEQTPSANI
jgi:hypothetical protein